MGRKFLMIDGNQWFLTELQCIFKACPNFKMTSDNFTILLGSLLFALPIENWSILCQ